MTDRRELEEGLSEARRLRAEALEGKRKEALRRLRDGLSVNAVCRSLRIDDKVVRRWAAEAGVTPAKYVRSAP